uniref:Uncharacterized protein n=1 Tax=Picea glauca TaxID=3330 RepID=A0A101M061_PICGL|nr:hypothetical protein ABT39_MTgene4482 [Picea glauca]QHR87429.1 hypothetical protein Q903MT_gene1439 [Picea sitchensis]
MVRMRREITIFHLLPSMKTPRCRCRSMVWMRIQRNNHSLNRRCGTKHIIERMKWTKWWTFSISQVRTQKERIGSG